MGYFPVRYDSRVVIYENKMFIRLATELPCLSAGLTIRWSVPARPESLLHTVQVGEWKSSWDQFYKIFLPATGANVIYDYTLTYL